LFDGQAGVEARGEHSSFRHFNLANYLIRSNVNAREALAHRIASTLIRYQMNEGHLPNTLGVLREHLAQVSPSDVPASFDEVCALVEADATRRSSQHQGA
jgi:hypothetical protein